MFVDYYSILEIEFPSYSEEIKKSYRRLSLKWHPDKHLTEDTSKKMVGINEAYYVLKDVEKKSRYDAEYIIFIDLRNRQPTDINAIIPPVILRPPQILHIGLTIIVSTTQKLRKIYGKHIKLQKILSMNF